MSYRLLSACRCCQSTSLVKVLDLGSQPLANSYTSKPQVLPVFPLQLLVCTECCLSQLSVIVDPGRMFQEYLYVSGTSRTFRDHFADLAEESSAWCQIPPKTVLDIACNDGTLLEAFQRRGCRVRGVDPAANLVQLGRARGLDVQQGYWPQVQANVGSGFDLVTATNVLAHVADPHSFLAAALDVLAPDGMVIVEVPYCHDMILRCEWDTIYHEHLSYFLAAPLLRLADSLGAAVTHMRQVASHGGSLRFGLKRGPQPHCLEMLQLVDAETSGGLHDVATYESFARQVDANCHDLWNLVEHLAGPRRRLIGYGASAKGNTLLNYCPLPVDYIVDDNPLKQGHFTPGRQIAICDPESMHREQQDLNVLLLAWNFAKEIGEKLEQWRPGRDDQMIHYVPRVTCHDVCSRASFDPKHFLRISGDGV